MSENDDFNSDGNYRAPRPGEIRLIDRDIGGPLPPVFLRRNKNERRGHPSGNPFLNRLLDVLDKYRDLGEVVCPNGTMCIGKIPGKEKWFLCHIYSGLSLEQIDELAAWTKTGFPSHLKHVYMVCNGMDLFCAGQFRLYGYCAPARQDMPNYQPGEFIRCHPTACRCLKNVPRDAIFIGDYFGHYLYTTFASEIVYACTLSDATPIAQWPTIEDMVLDVAERLSQWFDENAQPIDPIVNEKPVLFESVN